MLPAGNVGSFCEASIFVLQKRTGPKELEVYLRLLELTHHVPRVPGCGSSCLRDMFQVKRLPTYLTFVFGVSARNPWRAACPSPDCIDFVQCPSPPLPCRFVHCPMLPPLGSSPLHLRFGSSSARAEVRCIQEVGSIFMAQGFLLGAFLRQPVVVLLVLGQFCCRPGLALFQQVEVVLLGLPQCFWSSSGRVASASSMPIPAQGSSSPSMSA